MAVVVQEVVGPPPRRALLPRHLRCRALVELLSGRARRAAARAWWTSRSASARRSWTAAPAGPSPPPTRSCRPRSGPCAICWTRRRPASGRLTSGPPPPYDPMTETEFLVAAGPRRGRDGRDAALRGFDLRRRLRPPRARARGVRGPRVLDFAPTLVWNELPLVPALRKLLAVCEDDLQAPVEIEFALSLPPAQPARLGFLQVRPLLVSGEAVEVERSELAGRDDGRGLDGVRSATGGTRCATSSTSSPGRSRRGSRRRSPPRSKA